MPLFKLLEDYKGWKAGVTIRLCSQDHMNAMGRGVGIEAKPEEPEKPKTVPPIEPAQKEAVKLPKTEELSNKPARQAASNMDKGSPKKAAPKSESKPEVSKEKPKPVITKEPAPATPRTFNTHNRKQKGSGKKRK